MYAATNEYRPGPSVASEGTGGLLLADFEMRGDFEMRNFCGKSCRIKKTAGVCVHQICFRGHGREHSGQIFSLVVTLKLHKKTSTNFTKMLAHIPNDKKENNITTATRN